MYLVQLLLPLNDNDGQPFPAEYFQSLRSRLAESFGGVTAFMRSPAIGLWQDDNERIDRDDLVMFEVMTEDIDTTFWNTFRRELETKFRQNEVVIRAVAARRL